MKKLIVILIILISESVFTGSVFSEPAYDSAKSAKVGELKMKESYFIFPDEEEPHEGTWLIWPHQFTYGKNYQKKIEPIFVEMAYELSHGENIHIVAYNKNERSRIETLLKNADLNLSRVFFYLHKTDDIWARDTGPFFVKDRSGLLSVLDFGFNGWGGKVPFQNDKKLRSEICKDLDIIRVDLQKLVVEPGAMEFDGNGVILATRSAIVNKNRNPNLTEKEIEGILKENLGVKKFIWLDGVSGIDITDFHIDGFAKFYKQDTIITMDSKDLSEWGLSKKDIRTLYSSKNLKGEKYKFKYLPLTKENVVLKNGRRLEYKGSYVNFYVGNSVVLLPFYNDINDEKALSIIKKLYPERRGKGIDVRELYVNGGMIHCVTQQQPMAGKY